MQYSFSCASISEIINHKTVNEYEIKYSFKCDSLSIEITICRAVKMGIRLIFLFIGFPFDSTFFRHLHHYLRQNIIRDFVTQLQM